MNTFWAGQLDGSCVHHSRCCVVHGRSTLNHKHMVYLPGRYRRESRREIWPEDNAFITAASCYIITRGLFIWEQHKRKKSGAELLLHLLMHYETLLACTQRTRNSPTTDLHLWWQPSGDKSRLIWTGMQNGGTSPLNWYLRKWFLMVNNPCRVSFV